MDFAHIRAFIPYAVLGAGLIVVVSSLPPPTATLKGSLGRVTSIANERSQEAQPIAKAEVLRSFAPQGSWFDATSSADTMREQPGTWAPPLAAEQTTIRIEADGATRISPVESGNEGGRRDLTRALKAFLDRVNASLPIDKSDQILLTLVKRHVAVACGQDCPDGQSLAANGHCLPKPTVAEDHPTVATSDNGTGDATAPPIPLSGAMMAGGPRSEPEKQSNAPSERAGTIENLFIHPLGGY
jgi:hypothetical protein